MADSFFDALETRDPAVREGDLMQALPGLVARARDNAPGFSAILAETDPASVTDRAALADLPVTRKSDLIERQRAAPPFGGLTSVTPQDCAHLFASPGPIHEPDTPRSDYWRMARALYAAGFRRGDILHNSFAYHLTPAGFMLETGAHALGCPVIPAGVGNTELQVQTAAHYRATGFSGTPSFLKVLLEKARELSVDLSSLGKALVSGEALPASLRGELAEQGVAVKQCYATADLGLIAYESPAMEGLILDENLILEVVRPGTGDPVAEGEVGEIVVTTLNPDYPLIRFATGDLSAVMVGASPCGRTNTRIKGWMGRADQSTKVKGMFVHPGQVAEVLKRHRIARGRLTVGREADQDAMTLSCEVPGGAAAADGASLAELLTETLQSVCKVRGAVTLVEPDSLPNDGKMIDDIRSYD